MIMMKNAIKYKKHDIYIIESSSDLFMLYAPTLKKLLHISKNLALQISEFGISPDNANKDIEYLSKLFDKALSNSIEPFAIQSKKSSFFHLALGLTQDCTLECLYCHAEAGKRKEMTVDLIDSSLKHAFETTKKDNLKRLNISFAVGGEPTTNWKLFTNCVNLIKAYERNYSIPTNLSMTTNGFYGNTKRVFITKYFDNILLSFDGTQQIQNLHRPTRAGKDSFNFVKETAKYYVKNVKSFAIRSTISNISVAKMPEIVRYFVKTFGINYHIVFEPLVPIGRAIDNSETVFEPSQDDFIKYYILAKELAKELGIEIRTSAANQQRLVTGFCGAMTIPSFTVTTDGIITTCERDSDGDNYWYGNYSKSQKEFEFNSERLDYNKTLVEIPEKCNDCFCKWHCAGDCPDLRILDYNRCYVNQELIKYELKNILEK